MAQGQQRFAVLDGWRGLCALLVALYHLNVVSPFLDNGLIRHAYLFVDFFFVLSGFVITHTYWGKLTDAGALGDFTVRRFARIWPLHAALLAAFVAVECLKAIAAAKGVLSFPTAPFTAPNATGTIFPNLVLAQAFGLTDATSWNFPSWSIAAEFWTYLVFALLAWIAFGGGRKRAATLLGGLIATAGLLVLVLRSPHGMDATYDYGLARCLYGFFVGHFTYRLWRQTRALHAPAPSLELIAPVLVVAFVALAGGTPAAFCAPVVFAVAVYIFAFESGAVSRAMGTRPFQWLGARSYSIYMVHAFVVVNLIGRPIQILEKLTGATWTSAPSAPDAPRMIDVGDDWAAAGLIAAYIAIVLATAALTYRLIEMPAQRLLLKRWSTGAQPRRSVSGPAPAA